MDVEDVDIAKAREKTAIAAVNAKLATIFKASQSVNINNNMTSPSHEPSSPAQPSTPASHDTPFVVKTSWAGRRLNSIVKSTAPDDDEVVGGKEGDEEEEEEEEKEEEDSLPPPPTQDLNFGGGDNGGGLAGVSGVGVGVGVGVGLGGFDVFGSAPVLQPVSLAATPAPAPAPAPTFDPATTTEFDGLDIFSAPPPTTTATTTNALASEFEAEFEFISAPEPTKPTTTTEIDILAQIQAAHLPPPKSKAQLWLDKLPDYSFMNSATLSLPKMAMNNLKTDDEAEDLFGF